MINQKLQGFKEDVKPIGQILTRATLELYYAVAAQFLPTPAKIHYLFNLRDISKVQYIDIGNEFEISIPQALNIQVPIKKK